jgi:2-C-methyl-D-erythritol 2,4-cyclodiphosphate synthase
MLGGIEIPHDRGLYGHSNADAVLHALINAVLGAMAEGDIGTHFPDKDPRYKGIASGKMLTDVLRIIRRKRFSWSTPISRCWRRSPSWRRIIRTCDKASRASVRLALIESASKRPRLSGLGGCDKAEE